MAVTLGTQSGQSVSQISYRDDDVAFVCRYMRCIAGDRVVLQQPEGQ